MAFAVNSLPKAGLSQSGAVIKIPACGAGVQKPKSAQRIPTVIGNNTKNAEKSPAKTLPKFAVFLKNITCVKVCMQKIKSAKTVCLRPHSYWKI